MPCDSRITNTQMTDEARVLEALAQAGLKVLSNNGMTIGTEEGLLLSRRTVGEAYRAQGAIGKLAEVGKKYAEIGMRQWARKNGLLVRSLDEKGATLVSVRR